jgi:glycosyltransferase involved in cell wall biosynthesis
MRTLLTYAAKALPDFLKHNPCCRALASYGLAVAARLSGRNPTRALALLVRAARACPGPRRLRRLEARLRAQAAELDPAAIDWAAASPRETDRRDVPKAILLKPPVSGAEKGVLYVTFEDQWLRLLRSGKAGAIADRYDLVLGPTWSPPHDVPMLLAARLWPGRLYTLLSTPDDAASMRQLSDRLRIVPVLVSGWVNPDPYRAYLGTPKQYDIVMLANFAAYKRHWLFFHTLRRLPRHYRVLLLGTPLGTRTEQVLRDEARAFGVHDRFELHSRLSDAAVAEGLCRSRVSLIFSAQEGACIAVAESLLADTPVGLFRTARVGSRTFVNDRTGVLLDGRDVAGQVRRFVDDADRYSPLAWALENISCYRSHEVLNATLRDDAGREGRPWTRDIVPFAQSAQVRHVSADDERALRPWYDDFAREYGLRLGVARPAGAVAEQAVAQPLNLGA